MAPPHPLLCLLLSLCLALAPLSHAHAHVTGEHHEHIDVHGGHDHDLAGIHHDVEDHHSERSGGHHDHDDATSRIVDMAPDGAKSNFTSGKFLQWFAILGITFALVSLVLTPLRIAAPPPRTRTRPPSPYPHALPLLRGPPLSI